MYFAHFTENRHHLFLTHRSCSCGKSGGEGTEEEEEGQKFGSAIIVCGDKKGEIFPHPKRGEKKRRKVKDFRCASARGRELPSTPNVFPLEKEGGEGERGENSKTRVNFSRGFGGNGGGGRKKGDERNEEKGLIQRGKVFFRSAFADSKDIQTNAVDKEENIEMWERLCEKEEMRGRALCV